ncbi:MAG: adventurous gliding motility lipoprotein CglB [Cystobacter sp.]
MRAKLNFLRALVVGTLSGVLATACQTYDFEPVEPLAISQTTETRVIEARARKPNLMLLVDTSGSMNDPVNPALPACRLSNGETCRGNLNSGVDARACNTRTCPTRWSDLQEAMSAFLAESGTVGRIGLATYPDNRLAGGCGASSSISVPLPEGDVEDDATLRANAEAVKNKLLSIKNDKPSDEDPTPTPIGGTPSSTSLRFVGSRPELQGDDRADFVLLLTDGTPNCNANYPSPYGSPGSTCFCTLGSPPGSNQSLCSSNVARTVGCIDTDASVDAVKQLRNTDAKKDIRTIVVAFGTEFKSDTGVGTRGAATLNSMAQEGGFARKCSKNADCGAGDSCDLSAGLCARRFYQAENKDELSRALKAIAEQVVAENPCEVRIAPEARPTSTELMVVYLNGERLAPGGDTWEPQEPGIVFKGSTCARIEASSPSSPARIEVRAVQSR